MLTSVKVRSGAGQDRTPAFDHSNPFVTSAAGSEPALSRHTRRTA